MTASITAFSAIERIVVRMIELTPEIAVAPLPKINEDDAKVALATFEDPERFQELFQNYYSTILNYLYRRTLNQDLAEDLTSRTFHAAFEFLRKGPRSGLHVKPWLYRIATNTHLSYERANSRFWKHAEILMHTRELFAPARPDDELIRKASNEEVRRLLLALPDAYRTPLVLRFYEELGYEEIAEILKVEEGSARSRVSRGLSLLKCELARRSKP